MFLLNPLVKAVDFEVFFELDKRTVVEGIFVEAEEVGGAAAVGASEAGDAPVGNGGDGAGEVVFEVVRGADGEAADPLGLLAEPVDVPVHALAETAVAGHALIEIFLRRAGIDVVPFREMEDAEFSDFHIPVFRETEHEKIVPAVPRFPVEDFERRREEPHAPGHSERFIPPEGGGFPVHIGRGVPEGLCERRVGVVVRQKPLRPVPLDEDQKPRMAAAFSDGAEVR